MSDAAELREVLGLLKEHGLVPQAIKVGAISMQLARPAPALPETTPRDPQKLEEVRSIATMSREQALPILRQRSREQFGYVKDDDTLWELRGAL